MNNWKVIPTIVFATVLIFGAGVFTGGMLVDYVKQGRPHQGTPRSKPPAQASAAAPTNNPALSSTRPPPQVLSKDFLQRLDGELHLTKDQHEAVQKIIGDGQNEMRKVIQDSRLEIREVLTAEQRDQFDELMKRPFHKPIFNTNAPPPAAPATSPATSSTTL
ncbi:MAG TPA: hypothetical protein VH251_03430 [Verrucomicrobiae bacterium]|nr:hypothetical protein [Verrucomicrobiae bacterium]